MNIAQDEIIFKLYIQEFLHLWDSGVVSQSQKYIFLW